MMIMECGDCGWARGSISSSAGQQLEYTIKKLLFEFQLIFHTHSVVLVDAENRRREQSWLKNIGAQPVADEQMVTKD